MSKSAEYELGAVNHAYRGDNHTQGREPSHVELKIDNDEVKNSHDEFPEIMQEEFEDMDPPEHPNCLANCTSSIYGCVTVFYSKHRKAFYRLLIILIVCLYFAYFGYAMHVERLRNESSIRLLWVTCTVVFFVVLYFLKRWKGKQVARWFNKTVCLPWSEYNDDHGGTPKKIAIGVISCLIFAGLVAIIVVLVALKTPYNLMSLLGIAVQLLFCYIFSVHPDRIKWRPILVGLLLQFVFALLILKTQPGYDVFKFIGDRVAEFLAHTAYGKEFVFDTNNLKLTSFAFSVLPIILFFSCVISILFYLGVMQLVIQKVAAFMQVLMGTTAGESLNAAGNIFIGMTEAPLMIRPFIGRMTNSELHAVMTGGFATVAGSVLGAYISMGNPANHLISASVMSAPAALAVSKMLYPETKKSITTSQDVKKVEKPPHKNMVEAAAAGVISSIPLVANIAAIIIGFLAILDFVNKTLTWCGARAGMTEDLTFQLICSYVLWPLAFVMGVEVNDCRKVSELIGVKTFINEFMAYGQLGIIIKNSANYRNYVSTNPNLTAIANGTHVILRDAYQANVTYFFEHGILHSLRSEVIATYSLCGFANFGSIGIMIGALSAMAPRRQRDIAGLAVRSMMAGNVACFLTACIAGLFYEPPTGS